MLSLLGLVSLTFSFFKCEKDELSLLNSVFVCEYAYSLYCHCITSSHWTRQCSLDDQYKFNICDVLGWSIKRPGLHDDINV